LTLPNSDINSMVSLFYAWLSTLETFNVMRSIARIVQASIKND